MKQEDKQLLLVDLCARLSYGIKVDHFGTVKEFLGIIPSSENVMVGYDINDYEDSIIEDIKPYLRPMSSMTEEERYEIQGILGKDIEIIDDFINIIDSSRKRFSFLELQAVFDWLNAHHFDYRGLINKGLALVALEGMYNLNEK